MSGQIGFGAFRIDADGGAIFRHGVQVPVSYRGLRLLTALAQHTGEVMSKADLLEAGWPGLVVEEGNLTVQIAALRKLLGPNPEGTDWILTVPRVGYRFAGKAVRLASDEADGHTPTGPSIAVLPFINLGDDPAQQHFADGLAEDLIARLAHLKWLFVSARNSSFSFRGQVMSARDVGRHLGVRYVLDGSVRQSGARLRIGAELSDASTGLQVWSDRYDVDLSDFLQLQDQISESVTAKIEPRLHAAEYERIRTQSPESLDAWGLVMKAMPGVWTWGSATEIDASEALLHKALDIDPDYPRAIGLLAWIYAARVQLGWTAARDGLKAAREMAERAIRRDPADPWPHLSAGYVHMVGRSHEAALAELGEAVELNPSFALAHLILGSTYGYGGFADDGLHHLSLANRLSPRDFAIAANHATTGLCHFIAARYQDAIDEERRAVALRPHFGTAWRTFAAAAGMTGDHVLGAYALGEALRLQPTLNLDWIERCHPIVQDKDRTRYAEGLRVAGLT